MKILSTSPKPDVFLSVATLNTWHGLGGKGWVNFSTLETREERIPRLERQVMALKALNADVIFLQEVNPLPFRAYWYARELGRKCYFHTVNSGVKLGWGLPTNLNEGLAILCPPNWESQFVGSKRLSGSFRLSPFRLSAVTNPFVSFQFHESRAVCAVRLHIPRSRQVGAFRGASSVLLCVTHLHHAPSLTPRTRALLDKAKLAGMSNAEEEYLLEQFQAAETRRVSELDILSDWIEEVRKPGEAVVLAGDFNSEPDSPAVSVLSRRSWSDSWVESGNPLAIDESSTWDPQRNPLAYRGQRFHQKETEYSEDVAKFIREADASPRRIDYLFYKPWYGEMPPTENKDVGCFGRLLSVKRFGYLTAGSPGEHFGEMVSDDFSPLKNSKPLSFASGTENHFISDHYGLFATFGK